MSPLWFLFLLLFSHKRFYCNYINCSLQTHQLEKQHINTTKLEQKLFNCPAPQSMNMQQPITRWPDVVVVADFAIWPNCNHGKYPLPRHHWTEMHCRSTLGYDIMYRHSGLLYIFFQLTTQLFVIPWVAIGRPGLNQDLNGCDTQLLEVIHSPHTVYLPQSYYY